MKVIDIIFALIAGRIVGFLMGDFLHEWGIDVTIYWELAIWIALPFLSLFCLWLAQLMGRKFLSVYQAAKHLLVGIVAIIFDLKLFEFLVWITGFIVSPNPLAFKAISFIASTTVKYWGNKYWAFGKLEKENWYKEITHFFLITLCGLLIDVAAFYYFTNILGPQFGLAPVLWIKVSVIISAAVAAAWNFLGYKLLVFKK